MMNFDPACACAVCGLRRLVESGSKKKKTPGLNMTSQDHVTRLSSLSSPGGPRNFDADLQLLPSREKTTKVFPLNSRRLISQYVVSIAKAMGLPTKGSVEEIRLIVEGSLTKMGQEPRNVQVNVTEDESGKESIYLCDSCGAFVEALISPPDARRTEVKEMEVDGRDHRGESVVDETSATLEEARARNRELQDLNYDLLAQVSMLKGEVSMLADKQKEEADRANEVWRMSCEQVTIFDEAVTAKDSEIDSLRVRITELEASRSSPVALPTHAPALMLPHAVTWGPFESTPRTSHHSSREGATLAHSTPRRGKAPPVSEFTGDYPECTLEDWLPSLERAIVWNAWTEEEQIIQLAGHLKSRALQEWNLLRPEDRASFAKAVEALRLRLDCWSKTLVALDFRHATQREGEPVSDFVRCLERTFRTAYGRESMLAETKDMLLYAQLQEGLHLQLLRAPAVSGAKNYQELIVVAKNEERRLADLRRRQEYARSNSQSSQFSSSRRSFSQQNPKPKFSQSQGTSRPDQQPVSESKTERVTERKEVLLLQEAWTPTSSMPSTLEEGRWKPTPTISQAGCDRAYPIRT